MRHDPPFLGRCADAARPPQNRARDADGASRSSVPGWPDVAALPPPACPPPDRRPIAHPERAHRSAQRNSRSEVSASRGPRSQFRDAQNQSGADDLPAGSRQATVRSESWSLPAAGDFGLFLAFRLTLKEGRNALLETGERGLRVVAGFELLLDFRDPLVERGVLRI